ncbi:hypothetical protein [Curtobacterium sp. VKM Ac-2884]|uniref:hypothetical protein n=1 Tax=Curtobacterium sp. VKM Ac-2884 TaxID=2783818 RepID=UPI00188C27CB|nr:hypothetical protein [Curtobacterium sp. VKM Ac-2884]MBF4603745.1 hypothetical protein [Curtobacterium sp. VKM Ac-2884]
MDENPTVKAYPTWLLYLPIAAGVIILVCVATWFFMAQAAKEQACADRGWSLVETRGTLCVDGNGSVRSP